MEDAQADSLGNGFPAITAAVAADLDDRYRDRGPLEVVRPRHGGLLTMLLHLLLLLVRQDCRQPFVNIGLQREKLLLLF